MSSKLSVEEVLSNLEERAAFHRAQEALHAQQEAHHHEQRAHHAAELEKVLQSLEAFRPVAAAAVDMAQPPPSLAGEEDPLPPAGRLMVSRLLRRVIENSALPEPFGAAAVAAEANRLFADRLPGPVSARTASDVLRRMLAEGAIQLAQKGTARHEALYQRRTSG